MNKQNLLSHQDLGKIHGDIWQESFPQKSTEITAEYPFMELIKFS